MARDRKGLIFSAADIFVRRCTSTFNLHVQRAGTKGHSSGSKCSMRCVLLWNVLQLADAETRLFVLSAAAAPDLVVHRHSQSCVYEQKAARKWNQQCFAHNNANYVFAVRMFKQQAGLQICDPLMWRCMCMLNYFTAVLMLLAAAKCWMNSARQPCVSWTSSSPRWSWTDIILHTWIHFNVELSDINFHIMNFRVAHRQVSNLAMSKHSSLYCSFTRPFASATGRDFLQCCAKFAVCWFQTAIHLRMVVK